MYDQVINQMNEFGEAILKDERIHKIRAQLMKKSLESLIEAGFTREEAIQLIAGQGVGFSSDTH